MVLCTQKTLERMDATTLSYCSMVLAMQIPPTQVLCCFVQYHVVSKFVADDVFCSWPCCRNGVFALVAAFCVSVVVPDWYLYVYKCKFRNVTNFALHILWQLYCLSAGSELSAGSCLVVSTGGSYLRAETLLLQLFLEC